jgi:hypothetical protein
MNAATREIVADTMTREWFMSLAGFPGLSFRDYSFSGTAQEAVDDFRRRFPIVPVKSFRIVMDDGDWTIRLTFADNSVATVFVA